MRVRSGRNGPDQFGLCRARRGGGRSDSVSSFPDKASLDAINQTKVGMSTHQPFTLNNTYWRNCNRMEMLVYYLTILCTPPPPRDGPSALKKSIHPRLPRCTHRVPSRTSPTFFVEDWIMTCQHSHGRREYLRVCWLRKIPRYLLSRILCYGGPISNYTLPKYW